MFEAQAHSFTQQARLAISLAWIAGYTNIVTVITCGTVTSHVSGTASNLGRQVAEGAWPLALLSLHLLLLFFLGALVSGALTEFGHRRGWESIYAFPIAVETVLLALFAVVVEAQDHGAPQSGPALYLLTGIASFAMGLQNATITRISTGVVRTTHITGVLTDLGIETAQFVLWLRDRGRDSPPLPGRAMVRSAAMHPTAKRLALLVSIAGSFSLGAGLGASAHQVVHQWAMFPPVAFLIWLVHRDIVVPIAEVGASQLFGGEHGVLLPDAMAVFHIRNDANRRGAVHRMPNLQAWAGRLPGSIRVVVLDLGEKTMFDSNAVLELRAVLRNFAASGRRLIVAGVGGAQYHEIRRLVTTEFLDPTNFCPDLELAIARAMTMVE